MVCAIDARGRVYEGGPPTALGRALMLADGAMDARGRVYGGGPPTALDRTLILSYYKGKFISLLCLTVKLTQMLYVPWVG